MAEEMSLESLRRLEIAQRVVAAHVPIGLKAAYLTGSVAEGIADEFSDIDMGLFFEALPPEADLIRVREELDLNPPKWILGSYEEGEFCVSIRMDAVEVQYGISPIALQDQYVDDLLAGKYLKGPEQKIAMGTLFSIPLHGLEIVESWKASFRAYPDELAAKMIAAHRPSRMLSELYSKIENRDCELWQRRELVDLAYNICGMLAGLNRKWHADFQFKRLRRFADALEIAPDELVKHIETMVNAPIPLAVEVGQRLLNDTLALLPQTTSN